MPDSVLERETLTNDWAALIPAERVGVRRPYGLAETGSVDLVAGGGDAVWVWLDHGQGRVLAHKDEGAEIWRLTRG
jgi:hypothetical protein